MLEIELLGYEDLPKSITDETPNNGHGREYANYLVIWYKGHIVSVHSDAVKPEDATLNRDFSWVQDEIEKAYGLGCDDGYKLGGK